MVCVCGWVRKFGSISLDPLLISDPRDYIIDQELGWVAGEGGNWTWRNFTIDLLRNIFLFWGLPEIDKGTSYKFNCNALWSPHMRFVLIV